MSTCLRIQKLLHVAAIVSQNALHTPTLRAPVYIVQTLMHVKFQKAMSGQHREHRKPKKTSSCRTTPRKSSLERKNKEERWRPNAETKSKKMTAKPAKPNPEIKMQGRDIAANTQNGKENSDPRMPKTESEIGSTKASRRTNPESNSGGSPDDI